MNKKKFTLLFLGLFLPILIFIFLRMFGRNQFDVPLMHAGGVEKIPSGCQFDYPSPYHLHDSIATRALNGNSGLVLITFAADQNKLDRGLEKFNPNEVRTVDSSALWRNSEVSEIIKKCALLVEYPYDVVLIDRERNIRGYYHSQDRDDIDRLKAELTIILKKY